jgi:DNA-binding IclR family transcriptional regulator
VRLTERVGYPRPAHCTAIGKVMLADLSAADLAEFVRSADLRPLTPKTITSASQLRQELERVRAQGYAVDDEEFAQGIRCLAAPVRNFSGQVAAAVGVSGPVWRVSLDRVAQLTEFVVQAGHRLSEGLGYPAPSSDPEGTPARVAGTRRAPRAAGPTA